MIGNAARPQGCGLSQNSVHLSLINSWLLQLGKAVCGRVLDVLGLDLTHQQQPRVRPVMTVLTKLWEGSPHAGRAVSAIADALQDGTTEHLDIIVEDLVCS